MSALSIYRISRLGLVNFWRNRWLSLAATLMMTLTLIIISFFAILNLGINAVSDAVRSRLDIEVYFYDDKIADAKISSLANELKQRSDVSEVKYISKEEAKENFANYEVEKEVISQINDNFNPLPRSLRIKANNPEEISSIASFLKQDKYKEIICQEKKCVSYNYEKNRQTTSNLLKITRFVSRSGYVISALFVLVSILIVLNTIRLTVYTRRDEIEIMKLVGASHAFIRYPFVIESILYGFIATLLSLALIATSIKFTSPIVNRYTQLVNLDMLHYFTENIWKIIGLQLAISAFVAIICSALSIRKYLRT